MTETANDNELVLTRLFDAPAARIYEAWTNAEILKKWFAPLPFTTPEADLDVRVGGQSVGDVVWICRGPVDRLARFVGTLPELNEDVAHLY